jgi:uncharacterized membrane protein
VASRRLDAILLLSLAGVGVAAYLSWVALDHGREVACGPLGDCQTVQDSLYARVAGVSVAYLGLGMYLALLFMTAVRRFRSDASRILTVWTIALALSGTLYSAYLTYLELFVIDAICAWCVVSAVVVTAIFLLSIPDARALAADGGRAGRLPEAHV